MALRLTALGTGYLGATHAACMAELGFEVLGLDADPERISALAAGKLPFYEPGLEVLLDRGSALGAAPLHFVVPGGRGLRGCPLHLCGHAAAG